MIIFHFQWVYKKVVLKFKQDDFLKTRMLIQAAWHKYDFICVQNVTVGRYSCIWWTKKYLRSFGSILEIVRRKYVFPEEPTCLWNGLGWGDIEETWESRRRAPSSPKKRQRGPDELCFQMEWKSSKCKWWEYWIYLIERKGALTWHVAIDKSTPPKTAENVNEY